MSEEAKRIMAFMLKGLSGMSHGYRQTVEGSFDCAIENYGYVIPSESKDDIVNKVIRILASFRE